MRSRLAIAALALTFATASSPRQALAFGPGEDPSALIGEGDALHGEGKYAEAAKAYATAYQKMQPDEQASPLGELVVSNAAKEYQQAFLESGDIAMLEASRDVLRKFVDDRTEGAGAVPGHILKELRRVEGVIANLRKSTGPSEPAPDETTETTDTTEADPGIAADTNTDTGPRKPPKRVDPLGLGLTITGAAFVVAGAALLGVGAVQGPQAEDRRDRDLASDAFMMASPAEQMVFEADYAEWVDDRKKTGVAMMAAGGAGLGVGVALVIVGAIRLARGKKTQSATAIVPAWGPRRAGLVLSGRF